MSYDSSKESESLKLIYKFICENKGLVSSYFIINIFTLFLETIILSNILSKVFLKLGTRTSTKRYNSSSFSYMVNNLKYLFIAYLLIFSVIKTGYSIRSYIYDSIIPKFNSFIKIELYNRIVDRYKINFETINIGELLYNFQHLPITFEKLLIECLQEYIPNTIAIIMCLCFLLYFNKTIFLVALASIIFLSFVLYYRFTQNVILSIKEHEVSQFENQYIQNKLDNLFDIYTSSLTEEEKQRFVEIEDETRRTLLHNYSYSTQTSFILEVISVVTMVLIFYIIYTQQQNIPNAVMLILVLSYFTSYLTRSANNFISVVNILGYFKQSDKFLDNIKPVDIPFRTYTENINFNGPIEFKNIKFSYSRTTTNIIFNDLTFNVMPSELTVIYGRSGSGKSTLFKLLMGFYTITSGDITIGNVSIKDINLDTLRKNIAVLTQNISLFNTTIIENMRYGTSASEQQVIQLMNELGISDSGIFSNLTDGPYSQVGINGSLLSGGQKQIVGIVRTILKSTPIILMDEPTSALSGDMKLLVLNIIKNLKNKTILIISHDQDVAKYTNNVYTLVDGYLKNGL